MSINLIDNFEVGVNKPIDNRFVVGPEFRYTDKDQIVNKYPGLRVWDIESASGFLWNGIDWISDSVGSDITGSGQEGKIALFSTNSSIGISIITESSSKIGINRSNPTKTLDVNGVVKATSFEGSGSSITNINATNISTGRITLDRLPDGNISSVIVGSGNENSPTWAALSTLTIGTSTKSQLSITSANTSHYLILSSSASGDSTLRTSSGIRYNPSSGNLGISTNQLSNNKLNINGSVSIGNENAIAPSGGLYVHGKTKINDVSETTDYSDRYTVLIKEDGVLEKSKFLNFPIGGIITWSGTLDSIPDGWVLCDGGNGTPNLSGSFLIHDVDKIGAIGETGVLNSDIMLKYYYVVYIMFIGN